MQKPPDCAYFLYFCYFLLFFMKPVTHICYFFIHSCILHNSLYIKSRLFFSQSASFPFHHVTVYTPLFVYFILFLIIFPPHTSVFPSPLTQFLISHDLNQILHPLIGFPAFFVSFCFIFFCTFIYPPT